MSEESKCCFGATILCSSKPLEARKSEQDRNISVLKGKKMCSAPRNYIFQDIKSPLQTDFAVCDFYDGRRGISCFNLYIHLLLCLGPGKSMCVRRSKNDNKTQSQLSVSISFYCTALTSLTTGPGEVMH